MSGTRRAPAVALRAGPSQACQATHRRGSLGIYSVRRRRTGLAALGRHGQVTGLRKPTTYGAMARLGNEPGARGLRPPALRLLLRGVRPCATRRRLFRVRRGAPASILYSSWGSTRAPGPEPPRLRTVGPIKRGRWRGKHRPANSDIRRPARLAPLRAPLCIDRYRPTEADDVGGQDRRYFPGLGHHASPPASRLARRRGQGRSARLHCPIDGFGSRCDAATNVSHRGLPRRGYYRLWWKPMCLYRTPIRKTHPAAQDCTYDRLG